MGMSFRGENDLTEGAVMWFMDFVSLTHISIMLTHRLTQVVGKARTSPRVPTVGANRVGMARQAPKNALHFWATAAHAFAHPTRDSIDRNPL